VWAKRLRDEHNTFKRARRRGEGKKERASRRGESRKREQENKIQSECVCGKERERESKRTNTQQ